MSALFLRRVPPPVVVCPTTGMLRQLQSQAQKTMSKRL